MVPVEAARGGAAAGEQGRGDEGMQIAQDSVTNDAALSVTVPERHAAPRGRYADYKIKRNFFETRVIEYQTGGALSWD